MSASISINVYFCVIVQFFYPQHFMNNLFELVRLQKYHENPLKISEAFLIMKEFKMMQIIKNTSNSVIVTLLLYMLIYYQKRISLP